ncbi:TrbI/VirB10 family protein [Breoghania sp. JC706]|uniref:TrbI/VirB10 family protein n=1 Tax=Breoghania sp. JC706 TaxID=3117732 RepID=UPI00300889CE
MQDDPHEDEDREGGSHEHGQWSGESDRLGESDRRARDEEQRQAEERRAAERERLLEERRARQTGRGRSGGSGRRRMILLVGAGLAALVILIIGPMNLLRALGLAGGMGGPKTSQVDLEVGRPTHDQSRLDFLVPAAPVEVKEEVDPNKAWNERFEALQSELENLVRSQKGPEVKLSDVKDLLGQYNARMAERMERQRKEMAEENARLREAAERLKEKQRREEEDRRRAEEERQRKQAISLKQIASGSVVVDQSGAGAGIASGLDLGLDLDQNDRFLSANAGSKVETVRARKLADPSRTVVQGTIISAVLETAINTELPGNIRAQVTEPVFSFDGTRVLMPAGTQLIGKFNNDVEVAQKRVLIAWNRAITPAGRSVALGSTGTDVLGRAGTLGNVNNRLGTKLGAAVLISTVSALPTMLSNLTGGGRSSNSGTTINIGGSGSSSGQSAGGEVAKGIGDRVAEAGGTILEKYLSLPPIIRIPQGEEIRVFVNRDLIIR